ncbi:uncharacterized protein si:ch211-151h10.2 isoform X1 [Oryzias melastigma]|uniref:uncharacterized protein si:ch211-151h10.2 isoform X1 n=2 Tax=Oryzias melastigma TaxID=30732 RepID=UPI00168D7C05|nr:uncharacterized protein si:ch211-151h10.2 isoform X1 [Oryzias melastigma]
MSLTAAPLVSGREGGMWAETEQDSHFTSETFKLQMNQTQQTAGCVRTLPPWFSLAPAGVMWWIFQLEVLLHSSGSRVEVWSRLLLAGLLCVVLAVSLWALRRRLGPRRNQEEPESKQHQEAVYKSKNNHFVWTSQSRTTELQVPVSVALADSVLLCVLQEPLQDPSVAHIEALLSRLEAVARSLQNSSTGSEPKPEEDGVLSDKVKLTSSYLQERIGSLHALVQVQAGFEASVEDVLQGLDGLWKQLEELHTGVTLSKREGQGHKDLASAQTEAETLFAVLNHYKNQLGSCEVQLKESTQLLQELTWSHTHICNKVNSSSESVWPELLLQANIEQFDKVQESFTCLEQQTSTFQAHLEGLGKRHPELISAAGPSSATRRDSEESAERSNAGGSGKSSSLLLCGKASRPLPSPFGRLRKNAKKK